MLADDDIRPSCPGPADVGAALSGKRPRTLTLWRGSLRSGRGFSEFGARCVRWSGSCGGTRARGGMCCRGGGFHASGRSSRWCATPGGARHRRVVLRSDVTSTTTRAGMSPRRSRRWSSNPGAVAHRRMVVHDRAPDRLGAVTAPRLPRINLDRRTAAGAGVRRPWPVNVGALGSVVGC
jgi:hypothetical protein